MKKEEELQEVEILDILVGGENDIFEMVAITRIKEKNGVKNKNRAKRDS